MARCTHRLNMRFKRPNVQMTLMKKKVRMTLTSANAKSLGRRVQLKMNWESEKIEIMEKILRIKFGDSKMKLLLGKTKDSKIVEKNSWHDIYWGVCSCKKHQSTGKNIMGELLMLIRDSEMLFLSLSD